MGFWSVELPLSPKSQAQALMLPFLAFAALYMRYRMTAASVRPGLAWTVLLWVAFFSMAAVGLYQFGQQLSIWG